jgi:hypothetical protein
MIMARYPLPPHQQSILDSLASQGGEQPITSSDPDVLTALLNREMIEHVQGDVYRITDEGRAQAGARR